MVNNLQHLPNDIGFFFAGNLLNYKPIKNEYILSFCYTWFNFFLGNDQFTIKTSIYSGEKITRQNQISNEAQFLLFSVNSDLLHSLTMK